MFPKLLNYVGKVMWIRNVLYLLLILRYFVLIRKYIYPFSFFLSSRFILCLEFCLHFFSSFFKLFSELLIFTKIDLSFWHKLRFLYPYIFAARLHRPYDNTNSRKSAPLVKENSTYMKHKVWPRQPYCTG